MATTKIDLGFTFRRSNSSPIDDSSVWESLEAAQQYALGNSSYLSKGAPYVGQILTVIGTDGKSYGYIINPDRTLKPIGEGGGGGGGTVDSITSSDNSLKVMASEDNVDITIKQIKNPEKELL